MLKTIWLLVNHTTDSPSYYVRWAFHLKNTVSKKDVKYVEEKFYK